jgi:hypothetical protein
LFTFGSEADVSVIAIEQRSSQLCLEVADLLTDCRLRNMQELRCAAEPAVFATAVK